MNGARFTMGFFLIGRGADDSVRLLSSSLFATRQDALAELSRLSAQPGYDAWELEVFVADLESGAPVLLVRPEASETRAPVPEALAEAAAPVEQAAEPVAEPQAPEPAAVVPEAESVSDVPVAPEPAVGQTAQDGPAQAAPAAATLGEIAAPVAGLAAGGAAVLAADSAPEAEAEPTAAPADQDPLRDALLRTTEHMTAEGIEPPASAGLGIPAEGEPALASTAEQAPAEPFGAEPAAAIDETAFAPAVATEIAAGTWPWLETPAEPSAPKEPDASAPVETSQVLEPLGEPAPLPEEAPGPGDQTEEARPEADVAPAAVEDAQEPMSQMPAAQGVAAEPSDDEPEGESESDFILDLEGIQPVQIGTHEAALGQQAAPAEEASTAEAAPANQPTATPGYEKDSSASATSLLTEYTCDDCVYVDTCPNRDQRLPKDCGSFQWR